MSLLDCLADHRCAARGSSPTTALPQAMLEFEAALARARGAASASFPRRRRARSRRLRSARRLRCRGDRAEPRAPEHAGDSAGQALRERVRARRTPASAAIVHWGATSQDVTDTALVLLLEQARVLDGATTSAARSGAADALGTARGHGDAGADAAAARHADHVRTQGRRLDRGDQRAAGAGCATRVDAPLVLQFGGAAGTLAALGDQGLRVVAETARELDLRAVPPWHTNRDRLGALVTACGLLRRRSRQGRARHLAADAGRSGRGRRTGRRIVHDAAQAESRGMRRGARGRDAHAGAGRRVSDRR